MGPNERLLDDSEWWMWDWEGHGWLVHDMLAWWWEWDQNQMARERQVINDSWASPPNIFHPNHPQLQARDEWKRIILKIWNGTLTNYQPLSLSLLSYVRGGGETIWFCQEAKFQQWFTCTSITYEKNAMHYFLMSFQSYSQQGLNFFLQHSTACEISSPSLPCRSLFLCLPSYVWFY